MEALKSPKLELLQANVTNYEPEIEPDNFVGYYIKYNRRLSDNSTDLRNKRESNNFTAVKNITPDNKVGILPSTDDVVFAKTNIKIVDLAAFKRDDPEVIYI